MTTTKENLKRIGIALISTPVLVVAFITCAFLPASIIGHYLSYTIWPESHPYEFYKDSALLNAIIKPVGFIALLLAFFSFYVTPLITAFIIFMGFLNNEKLKVFTNNKKLFIVLFGCAAFSMFFISFLRISA